MNMQSLAELLEKNKFVFAKTLPEIPHFYTLKVSWEKEEEFYQAVEGIRHFGRAERFKGRKFIYFYANGYKYWTMGAPVDETYLINRAKAEYHGEYDQYAEKYDEIYSGEDFKKEDKEVIAKIGYKKGSVLDIGCGTGLFHEYVIPDRYTGVDVSRKMLSKFVEKYQSGHVELINCSFDDLHIYENYDYLIGLYGAGSYIEPDKLSELLYRADKVFVMLYREGIVPYWYEVNNLIPAYHTLKDYSEVIQEHNLSTEEYHNYVILKRGIE